MKQGKSITELAQEIERQRDAKVDMLADTRRLSYTNEGQLRISNGQSSDYPVNRFALNQIAERVGIPLRYANLMQERAPELLSTNINHWFQSNPEQRLVRTLDGRVRAFLSDRYQRIDNNHVAEAILPVLSEVPGIDFLSTEVTESRLYIKAVTHAVRAEVKSRRVGDFVEAGIMISNSEIGAGSLQVLPFFHFLICTNGMVRNKDGMRAYHVGRRNVADENMAHVLSDQTKRLEDMTVLSKVRDVVKAALDETKFMGAINAMVETTKEMIQGDPVAAVQVLGESYGMSQVERSSVLKHLIEGADLSRYGVMNAVTRTAEDLESYDRATEFETIGGAILDLPRSAWKTIATAS